MPHVAGMLGCAPASAAVRLAGEDPGCRGPSVVVVCAAQRGSEDLGRPQGGQTGLGFLLSCVLAEQLYLLCSVPSSST